MRVESGGKFALPNFANVKDDRIMATRQLSPDEWQAVARLAKQWENLR
jgi:hypothetical protein